MSLGEILEKLLTIEGRSGEEREVLSWIASFLQKCGFRDLYWQEYQLGKWNLYARRGYSPFLFAGHVDVHYVDRRPGFCCRNGFAFGAGVLDARGQIAALLDAISHFHGPVEVVFFSEEETSGAGSWNFIPPHPFEGAIVLEPTSFTLCTAFAGDVEVQMEIQGLGGHGAYPSLGMNALDIGFKIIEESHRIVDSLSPHPLFVPPLKLMWGKIEGGESSYVIPDYCLLRCPFPFPPPYSVGCIREAILALQDRYPVAVVVEDENPAWELKAEETVVQRLKEAVERVTRKESVCGGMPSWTDATYLFLKGVKSVVFGAGDLALAHSRREGVSLEELERLSGIFLSFLQ
ncbi:MAG: M20/M25/M40 family metallo-hydrolase [Atribacterota bacterium]|nr:M20/M25/M40 family metallo-hydrolase [Atribacterota bacterium]